MRVFFNAVVIQIFLSAYIFWRGWQALPDRKYIRIPYAAIFIVQLILYFIGFFGSDYLSFEVLHDFTWLGTTWMIFTVYMTVLLLFYDVVKFVAKRVKILPKSLDLSARKPRLIYFLSSLVFVAGIMAYGNYRFYNPVVNEMTLQVEKKSANVSNLKIVVASDIHAGYLIDRKILAMYVDKIMQQKPDLILIPGDIIDYDIKSVKEQRMEEEFKRLKAPYGVYASTGNHEYIKLDDEEDEEKITWLSKHSGLTLLRDTAVLVADSFYIIGREDDKCQTRKSLPEILQNVDTNLPMIVMNHEPHRLYEESENGIDVAVYGHTHNGQVFPNNIFVSLIYELGHGYKKKDNTHIYVSSGLGLAGPQYRIGTISEIVVLNVKFAND